MMEQKMKEEQERRKKKEMEERMSLEETKEQVGSLHALRHASPLGLASPRPHLPRLLFQDPEAAGEAAGPAGGEAPALPPAQESLT